MLSKRAQQLYVVKRDGRHQDVHWDKITARLQALSYGLHSMVDPVVVSQKTIQGLFKGMTTSELDDLSAENAFYLSSVHPDYGTLAARIAVSNLHKKTLKSFSLNAKRMYDFVDPGTEEAAPMLSDVVYKFIQENADTLDAAIVYDRDFGYDFFGFKTLHHSYLLKMNGEPCERPQQMIMRVACGIHVGDIEATLETYNLKSLKWFTHATPTLFNAATRMQQLSSCFLLSMFDDSIDGIYDTLKATAQISRTAGGIGVSVSNIRAKGSLIRGTNGRSNGILPMLRVYNESARYVDQGGGKRKASSNQTHNDCFS